MKFETFEEMSCDEAIVLLQNLKKENKDCKVVITSFDFDKNEEHRNISTPDRACILVKRSSTVILNNDSILPHMQLYSKRQIAENIVREGMMHDVLLRIVS